MLRIYTYKSCSTCQKAVKWLAEHVISYEVVAIREIPPTVAEFQAALAAGYDLKQLFNSSGGDYRALGMKDKLPLLRQDEALALLAGHGNLVKRPFVVSGDVVLVGFQPEQWQKVLLH